MRPVNDMIDLMITVIVMFLFAVLYFGQKQDAVTQTIINKDSTHFVDDIRSKGYLTKDMYEDFTGELSRTNFLYDITLEHTHTSQEPEYRMRTPDEIIDEQNQAYTGSNVYTHRPISTNIPSVSDPINNGSLNTQTNESILASAVNDPPSPGHIHNESCYGGHRHEEGNKLFLHQHQHNNGCVSYVSYAGEIGTCTVCGTRYYDYFYSAYWNPDTNSSVSSGAGYLSCPSCGARSVKDIEYHQSTGYSCGYNRDIDGDGWYDVCDYTVAYPYYMSYPLLNEISVYVAGLGKYVNYPKAYTAASGCYSYHVHGVLPNYPTGCIEASFSSNDSWTPMITSLYRNHGVNSFCYIPQTYTIDIKDNDWKWTRGRFVFQAERQPDGKVKFHLLSTYEVGDKNLYPEYLSAEEFSQSFDSYSSFVGFVRRYYDASYYSGQSSNNYYFSIDCSGGISLCDVSAQSVWYLSCGKTQSETLLCNQVITDLIPTNPVQTVATGDPIITTARAYYLDGSTKVIACTANFSTNRIGQNQPVTLSYSYTIPGASYTKTCNITVTVVARTKTCVNGHTYHLNADGSDPGCPYCRAWLRSLAVETPASGNITIYRGTTLPQNAVVLLATYLDGHQEHLYHEYVDNLDMNYIGTQTVTLSYKGKNTPLSVTVKRNITRCGVCGRYYELYPDDSDPGCPYCRSLKPVFTGKVLAYDDKKYLDEILRELYEGSGIYYFSEKDYLLLKLENTDQSLGQGLLSAIFYSVPGHHVRTEYGGYIRNTPKEV